MANRQHGRAGRPAAVRSASRPAAAPRRPGTPVYTEPEVRRWPHPLEDAAPAPEPAMHYIRCALSYQNQLLADIKALLERMALDRAEESAPPEEANPQENLSKM